METTEKAEVLAAVHRWASAMSTGPGPSLLIPLYDEDAALFATHNPELLTTPQERIDSFDGLADRQKKKDYKCTIGRVVTHVFGEGAVNTGYYTFSFTENDGTNVVLPYRFSFTYRKTPGGWLIVSHHSSPRTLVNGSPKPEKR